MTYDPAGPSPVGGPVGVPVCYRHPDRETYIRCTRCERPICPECMIPASVGFHCPDDVRAAAASTPTPRTVFGGRVSGDPGYVSKILIGLNVAMFVLQLAFGTLENRLWLIGLVRDGQLGGGLVGVTAGEWWRLGTAAFLHGSLLHLAFNMYALYLFGPALESTLGRARFVALYLVSALGGSAASYAFSPGPSVGASGAIFGLFGAYLVVSRHLGRDTSGLMVLLAINVFLGFYLPNIDWRAHAGGFATGAVLGALFVLAPRARRTVVHTGGVLAVSVVLLVWVAAHAANVLSVAGTGDVSTLSVLRCEVTAAVDPDQNVVQCVALAAQAPSLR